MPRPRGPHGGKNSKVRAVRLPLDLDAATQAEASQWGGFGQWCRDVLRQHLGIPLNREIGYQEGYAAGWAAANEKFREGLRNAES